LNPLAFQNLCFQQLLLLVTASTWKIVSFNDRDCHCVILAWLYPHHLSSYFQSLHQCQCTLWTLHSRNKTMNLQLPLWIIWKWMVFFTMALVFCSKVAESLSTITMGCTLQELFLKLTYIWLVTCIYF
jgi:hypothetical protein